MTIHVGLVGGGGISDTHARAALAIPGVVITAIQGPNEAKVRALCDRYGGTPYTSFGAFTRHRPMDVAVVGSPSGLHAVQGMAIARAGVHLLVEKPIDITTGRADALIAAAESAGVGLGVFFQDRFKPDVAALKQMIGAGRLGRPLLVRAEVPWFRSAEYYSNSRWRGTKALDGGGALMNQAIHTLDLMLWLVGDVTRVLARTGKLLHEIEVEDSGAAILEFAGGALGVFSFTTAAFPGYPRRLAISGEEGTAAIEHDCLSTLDLRDGTHQGRAEAGDADNRAASPVVGDASAHQAVMEDFLAAIRDGRPPCCDGRDARRSVALVEAIYQSSRSSQPVSVGS